MTAGRSPRRRRIVTSVFPASPTLRPRVPHVTEQTRGSGIGRHPLQSLDEDLLGFLEPTLAGARHRDDEGRTVAVPPDSLGPAGLAQRARRVAESPLTHGLSPDH